MPSSTGSSQPRDRTWVSCTAGIFFTIWATREGFGGWISPSDLLKEGHRLHSRLLRLRIEQSLLRRKQLAPGFASSDLTSGSSAARKRFGPLPLTAGSSYMKLAGREVSRCCRLLYTQKKELDGQVTLQATKEAKGWLPSGSNMPWGCGIEITNNLSQADRDSWLTGVSVSVASGSNLGEEVAYEICL